MWGSSLAFGLYHLPSQGWRGFLATLVFGLFAALVRQRTGSLLSRIVIHGLYDILVINLLPAGPPPGLSQYHIDRPLIILLADLLFLSAFLYLWRYHPSPQPAP